MITEKTIFDLLCMLDSGKPSLPFGRLVSKLRLVTKLRKATFPRANLFDVKDDLAVKTLTKMTIYTDKCICSGLLCKRTHFSKYSLPNIHCQRNIVRGNVA